MGAQKAAGMPPEGLRPDPDDPLLMEASADDQGTSGRFQKLGSGVIPGHYSTYIGV